MRIVREILIMLAVMLLAGCSEEPSSSHEASRPTDSQNDNDEPSAVTYDFSAELDDPSTRFTSPSVAMNYAATPGILVSEMAGAGYEFRDLTSGALVNFVPDVDLTLDRLTPGGLYNARLSINDENITLDSCVFERQADGIRWYSIHPSRPRTGFYTLVVDF